MSEEGRDAASAASAAGETIRTHNAYSRCKGADIVKISRHVLVRGKPIMPLPEQADGDEGGRSRGPMSPRRFVRRHQARGVMSQQAGFLRRLQTTKKSTSKSKAGRRRRTARSGGAWRKYHPEIKPEIVGEKQYPRRSA